MEDDVLDPIRTLQKSLSPCLAVFSSKNVQPAQVDSVKSFLFKSLNRAHARDASVLKINVRDPRDGGLCSLDNYPIHVRQIADLKNIKVFDSATINGKLSKSVENADENEAFRTVTELASCGNKFKKYQISIPKLRPWFDKYQTIIYDEMPMFDSDSTSFGGSLIVINGDYDEINQVDSLISTEDKTRTANRNFWQLHGPYAFKYMLIVSEGNSTQAHQLFDMVRQQYNTSFGSGINGVFLLKSDADLPSLRASLSQSMATSFEKCIHNTYSDVQNRRTIRSSFFSATKSFFGQKKNEYGDSNSGNSGLNPQEPLCLASKRLADSMVQCGMYSAAFDMYLQAYKDAENEGGSREMLKMAAAEMVIYSFALSSASKIHSKKDSEKLMDFITTTHDKYNNISRLKTMRYTFLVTCISKILTEHGDNRLESVLTHEIARFYVEMASFTDCSLRSAIALEQAAILFAQSNWPRKYGFNMVLAGNHFSNIKGHKFHALRCYRSAQALFQKENNSTFRSADTHIRWTIARLISSFEPKESIEYYKQALRNGFLPGGDKLVAKTTQQTVLKEYCMMIDACKDQSSFSLQLPKIVNKSFKFKHAVIHHDQVTTASFKIHNYLNCDLHLKKVELVGCEFLDSDCLEDIFLNPFDQKTLEFIVKSKHSKDSDATNKSVSFDSVRFEIAGVDSYSIDFDKQGLPLIQSKPQRRNKKRVAISSNFKIDIIPVSAVLEQPVIEEIKYQGQIVEISSKTVEICPGNYIEQNSSKFHASFTTIGEPIDFHGKSGKNKSEIVKVPVFDALLAPLKVSAVFEAVDTDAVSCTISLEKLSSQLKIGKFYGFEGWVIQDIEVPEIKEFSVCQIFIVLKRKQKMDMDTDSDDQDFVLLNDLYSYQNKLAKEKRLKVDPDTSPDELEEFQGMAIGFNWTISEKISENEKLYHGANFIRCNGISDKRENLIDSYLDCNPEFYMNTHDDHSRENLKSRKHGVLNITAEVIQTCDDSKQHTTSYTPTAKLMLQNFSSDGAIIKISSKDEDLVRLNAPRNELVVNLGKHDEKTVDIGLVLLFDVYKTSNGTYDLRQHLNIVTTGKQALQVSQFCLNT